MKVLITNSPLQFFHTTSFYHPDWGALNLAMLAGALDERHEIRVLDNWHNLWKSNYVLRTIKEFEPDLLAISHSTDGDAMAVAKLIRQVKQEFPKLPIVCGGQAACVHAEFLLNLGVKVIVIGEGEITFSELVNVMDNGQSDLYGIDGLVYLDGGEVVRTKPRPFVKNLDDLPFPARHLMPRLKSKFFPERYSAEIETSRGCPYNCEFCSITAFWHRTYRKKSNARIMAELRDIRYNLGASQVYFIDDVFGINTAEYTELFQMIIDEKLDIKWFTQIRPDTIANNPDMIRLAAESGFFGALVGFDSYDEEVLAGVKKKGCESINAAASRVMRENGIVIFGVHMFAIPGQGPEGFRQTYRLGRKYSDVFRMSFFSPIPGTPIYDRLKKEGQVIELTDRNYPYASFATVEGRDPKKIQKLYFRYWLKHYLSPSTIFGAIFAKTRILRCMKRRAYILAFRYIFHKILNKLKISDI